MMIVSISDNLCKSWLDLERLREARKTSLTAVKRNFDVN